jgi:hypothetical protein
MVMGPRDKNAGLWMPGSMDSGIDGSVHTQEISYVHVSLVCAHTRDTHTRDLCVCTKEITCVCAHARGVSVCTHKRSLPLKPCASG